jgi:alpha-glucosidase (family GH31 glycosyl hydrolase)
VDPTPDNDFGWWTSYSQDEESTFKLPFIPGSKYNLDNMTLSLNATHPDSGLSEYDLHSLFGHIEAMRTYEIFTDVTKSPLADKRTFFLSRSTFAGSGQYTQHWLGDNHRTWEDMKASIAGVMNMNMFGVPMVGPDTCGFF